MKKAAKFSCFFIWCRRQESNSRPPDYKSGALPTELHRHGKTRIIRLFLSLTSIERGVAIRVLFFIDKLFSGCLKGENAPILHGKHAVEALGEFVVVGNDDECCAQLGLQFQHQV